MLSRQEGFPKFKALGPAFRILPLQVLSIEQLDDVPRPRQVPLSTLGLLNELGHRHALETVHELKE
jgi:hypothetical protein